jgi:hypothetical protein
MTDSEIEAYLREAGCPEQVWRAGRKGLLGKWREFVDEVERGYALHLEDYRNDLDVRDLIARIGLQAEAAESDRRLRRLLVFTADPIWESENKDAFWLFGYPRNAGSDLRADLEAEGLLDE